MENIQKTAVDKQLFETLEGLYNGGNLQKGLTCTGRLFTTNGQRAYGADYLSREIPEFEYNGVKYVRDIVRRAAHRYIYEDGRRMPETNSVQWKRVEPITFEITNWEDTWSLKENIQKRGLFRRKQTANPNFWLRQDLELETDEAILAGLPFYPDYHHSNCSLWQNSLIRCFLQSAKSEELDGNPDAKATYRWDFRERGFLHEALNMTREATRVFVIPEYEKEIAPYAFCGCVGLKKVVVHKEVLKIGANAFSGIAFNWAYRQKGTNELVFARNLPANEEEYTEAIEIGEISKSFTGFDYGLFLSGANLDKLKELAKHLNAQKCTLPYAFVKKAQESGKLDMLLQANFKSFKNIAKIVKQKHIDEESLCDLYVFAHNIGCFSRDAKLRQRANVWLEERISPTVVKGQEQTPDIDLKNFHGNFDAWQIMSENAEFSDFLFSQKSGEKTFNYDEVKREKNFGYFLWQIYNEYLDQSQEMKAGGRFRDKNGRLMFAVFKESVNEQGQDNSKRKDLKPTVALFKKYFSTKRFSLVQTAEDEMIAQELSKWLGMEQKHFENAKKIMQEFHALDMSTNIVGKHLVDITHKIADYKQQTEDLAKLGLQAAQEIVEKISDTVNKHFTWDWLEKNDPMNFCLGLYCNCCANLAGVGYGIMHSNFVHPDVQNLVVKDAKGNPVAKSTLYVNRTQGYAIFNNVEIAHNMSEEQKEEIYHEYMEGVEAFVKEYNKQNPENPLTKVAVGSNLNDLENQLAKHGHKRGEHLEGIEFGKYGISGQRYTGDWMKGDQFVLWEAPKDKGGEHGQKDI